MSASASEWMQVLHFFQRKSRRIRVRILRLSSKRRQREENTGKDMVMELKNLKLYMDNIRILEENEKLIKQASLLHQENLELIYEHQKMSCQFDFKSTALNNKEH